MIDEKKIQQAIDRRLSRLAASDARKMRIREAVYAQRREEKPVKRKFTLMIAIAIAVMMMTSVAVAAGLGLFGELAQSNPDADRRLNTLDLNSTYINQSFELTDDTWPPVTLTVNQAYYDGTRVFISYTLTGPMSKVQTYTGTPENVEWDDVQEDTLIAEQWGSDNPQVQAMFKYLDGSEPRWGRAAHYNVHDGLQLEDGTYLDIIGGDIIQQEDGSIAGWKECEVPADAAADELTVQIGSFLSDTVYYQEGRTLCIDHRTNARESGKWHTFTVKKAGQSQTLTGSIAADDWSASANVTLSAVDIKGTVTVKAPQSWVDFWYDWEYTGAAPACIEEWKMYVDGVPVAGHNLNGGVASPKNEGEVVYTLCYQHVDPASEIMLVPHFWDGGDHPELGIVLKVAE